MNKIFTLFTSSLLSLSIISSIPILADWQENEQHFNEKLQEQAIQNKKLEEQKFNNQLQERKIIDRKFEEKRFEQRRQDNERQRMNNEVAYREGGQNRDRDEDREQNSLNQMMDIYKNYPLNNNNDLNNNLGNQNEMIPQTGCNTCTNQILDKVVSEEKHKEELHQIRKHIAEQWEHDHLRD